ncbi:MAG: hypothetical protein KatS3mg002_1654 [Candidatus Woesearchaeota archaeon]|nr:MAG: hypothetical protein KatS3mg002_1654 [Candidatus Woesearchaeota archaeon]
MKYLKKYLTLITVLGLLNSNIVYSQTKIDNPAIEKIQDKIETKDSIETKKIDNPEIEKIKNKIETKEFIETKKIENLTEKRIEQVENLDKAEEVKEKKEEKDTTYGNIYPWLPSMNNLYKGQVIQGAQELKPFGHELFFSDSTQLFSNIDNIPVGPDYILGPGDNLQISIWGSVNTTLDVTVDKEGKILLPEVGTFTVTGKSFGALKEQIRVKLSEIFNNVSVDVSIGKIRRLKVYVVGEAKKPGAYDITALHTLFHVLFMAGGPSEIGSMRNINVIRNNKVIKNVDLYQFLLKADKSGDIKLENGDIIQFKLKNKTASIQGLVPRPAIYEIKNEKTLKDVIDLAGGFLATSYLQNVQVRRIDNNKDLVVLNVNAQSNNIKKFLIKDKDSINIFPILQIDKKTVYLEGHVFRPGTYEYKSNMKLSDLIKSYDDLLPEPYLDYAQIVRLEPPQYRPIIIPFKLKDLMDKKINIELKPFDTVFLYSKWQFTRYPQVEIKGAIFKPGVYNIFPENSRISNIIISAGGLNKDTYLDRADIIRKKDRYGNKEYISINLKAAINGDKKHDILLKDEDVITLYKIDDIILPKKVTIDGEITNPGTYPLTENMKVKDLLMLGGTFNKSAYLSSAELVRYKFTDKVDFEIINIDLRKALENDPKHNILLKDFDTLIIKKIPNWEDMNISIEIKGEVLHPGKYIVSSDDRLSDVIKRAGGFTKNAFHQGILFYRDNLKEIQREKLNKLISDMENSILAEESKIQGDITKEEILLMQNRIKYKKQLLENMKKTDVTGRLVLNIDEDFDKFKKSESNVIVKPNDVLIIPKKPDFVIVQGEVYNPSAFVYIPGKNLDYYLKLAGDVNNYGDNSRIYIIKANGQVISNERKWFYNIRDEKIDRGDTILVPQLPKENDYFGLFKDIVDITYKVAVSAGIFVLRSSN